jgi:DNA polymerase-3 subunit delta'
MGKYFSDIKGQDNAIRILSAQIDSDMLSHAYIFLGSEGTGKEYLAREFAKLILCENRKGDECDSCVRMDNHSHPDYIVIDGRSGIKIDSVREAIERINLSPNLSKKKVLLFTKAENFGLEAVNALLKTFEEPPSDSVIILTAISEKSLPQTILSRGQKIKLNTLSSNAIKSILAKEFTDEEIEKVINYAGGSIGEAKKLITSSDKLNDKKILFSDAEQIIEAGSVISKFKILEAYDKNKNLIDLFDVFSENIFNVISFKMGTEEREESDIIGKNLDLSNLVSIGHKVLKIYDNLEYNINLRLAFEEMILDNLIVQDTKG